MKYSMIFCAVSLFVATTIAMENGIDSDVSKKKKQLTRTFSCETVRSHRHHNEQPLRKTTSTPNLMSQIEPNDPENYLLQNDPELLLAITLTNLKNCGQTPQ